MSMMSRLSCSTSSWSFSPMPRSARGVPTSWPVLLLRLPPVTGGWFRRQSTLAETVRLRAEGRRGWEPTATPERDG